MIYIALAYFWRQLFKAGKLNAVLTQNSAEQIFQELIVGILENIFWPKFSFPKF